MSALLTLRETIAADERAWSERIERWRESLRPKVVQVFGLLEAFEGMDDESGWVRILEHWSDGRTVQVERLSMRAALERAVNTGWDIPFVTSWDGPIEYPNQDIQAGNRAMLRARGYSSSAVAVELKQFAYAEQEQANGRVWNPDTQRWNQDMARDKQQRATQHRNRMVRKVR